MQVQSVDTLDAIDAQVWNRLAGEAYPFARHEFLLALEQSQSASAETGWLAQHLVVTKQDETIAILPSYLKTHSWGEYVFDHAWARAYAHHGLNYYPKWLSAIPFTPCQGPRILLGDGVDLAAVVATLLAYIQSHAAQRGISSWHCLFPELTQLVQWQALDLIVRQDVQFQWFNPGYQNFDDFLATLTAAKRKMIKRERRRVSEQGVRMLRIPGPQVSSAQWQAFFDFYTATYLKRGSQPYLNLAFFQQISVSMAEQLLLILAEKDGRYVGAALSFVGADTLYGRYWGCYAEYNALHFEACYYQGIDYCIAHQLARFDSGAQGEHKIARGFQPVPTYSAHWLQEARFDQVIRNYVKRERADVQRYQTQAADYLPFKRDVPGNTNY